MMKEGQVEAWLWSPVRRIAHPNEELPHLSNHFLRFVGMTNVNRLIAPERILANIRRMIFNPRQGTRDKRKFQVNRHKFRVYSRSLNEFCTQIARRCI